MTKKVLNMSGVIGLIFGERLGDVSDGLRPEVFLRGGVLRRVASLRYFTRANVWREPTIADAGSR